MIILGAGLAGLSCARVLQLHRIHYLLIEGAEKVGVEYEPMLLKDFSLIVDFKFCKQLIPKVLEQMKQWFGNQVNAWKHLRTYKINNALPNQKPPLADVSSKPMQVRKGLYQCGDYGGIASIQTALQPDRLLGEALVQGI